MSIYITKVKAIGVHGRFDFEQELQSGINILYGLNGAGKTTFLQIIANALNSDFQRFKYITFKYIEVRYSNGDFLNLIWNTKENKIQVSRNNNRRKLEIDKDANGQNNQIFDGFDPLITVFYMPAFRLLVDAWFSSKEQQLLNNQERTARKTEYSRKIFGSFTPQIEYPSVIEVIDSLDEDLKNARLKLATLEREAFLNSLAEFHGNNSIKSQKTRLNKISYDDILQVINDLDSHQLQDTSVSFVEFFQKKILLTKNNGTKLTNQIDQTVLDIYHKFFKALLEHQKECYSDLQSYLDAVNLFVVDKKIAFARKDDEDDSLTPSFCFKYDKDKILEVQELSSGERQIISLIYACYIAREKIILIDEPEISLHIDWQRDLLDVISKYSGQMIICTHSPIITSDHRNCLFKLNVKPTDELWNEDSNDLNEENEQRQDFNESEYEDDIASAVQF